jgi:hypothetical protein
VDASRAGARGTQKIRTKRLKLLNSASEMQRIAANAPVPAPSTAPIGAPKFPANREFFAI